MKVHLYAIYDKAAEYHLKLWEMQSDAQAEREFRDIFDKENPISKHPEDYYLCKMGSYENTTGKIESQTPTTLLTGLQAIANANQKGQAKQEHLDFIQSNGQDIQPGLTD